MIETEASSTVAPVRLALITTHPIQYQIPWFRRLAQTPGVDFKVFFGMLPDAEQQGVGFGVSFQWDIPLLEGYPWEVLRNTAKAPSLSRFDGISAPDVGKVLRAWRPGVVIVVGWQSRVLIQTLWACQWLGIPVLVRGESNGLASRPRWKRWLHGIWLRQYHGFLVIGKANRRFYLNAGTNPARIFGSPYFVDNERFCNAAEVLRKDREALRQQWDIPDRAICFLYAGKLVPKKRIFDLLKALDMTKSQNPCAHLLIAGTGELETQAREFAITRHLPISFAGFLNQTEIAKAYAAANCLVLPSDYGETWGLVVNEAMACGLPAIVSDRVGCGPDLVKEGTTGAIFPFGNIDALASCLVTLASDSDRLQKMGNYAQELIFRDYSVEKAVEGTLAAVQSTLATGCN